MSVSKITISIEPRLLKRLDQLVQSQVFGNRSQAFQTAIKEKIERLEQTRLATECAKLDINFEQSLAEEGISTEIEEWPEY